MRDFLDIVSLFETRVPHTLYHGTSDEAWESIRDSNTLEAMSDGSTYHHQSISFTANRKIAETFARQAANSDMTDKGIVIVFNGAKLASLYPLVPYHDADMSGGYEHFLDEEEYRIELTKITGIVAAVQSTYSVWVESGSEVHDRRTDSQIIIDAILEVRNDAAPDFAGKCEGAVGDLSEILTHNDIDHDVVEGRYMQPMTLDGKKYPFTPHWWIEVKNYILDPTREQFGAANLIVNKNHTDGRLYRHGGVGQVG